MLKRLSISGMVFVLVLLFTAAAASTEETKTIHHDGVPVELDNLWNVTPTVEVTIGEDLQLTIAGLDTWSDPPPAGGESRRPDTLAFYIYPYFPDYTDGCLMSPQPYLTTLPPGAVTEQPDGTFVLTYNLRDLEQNYCSQPLQGFINDGPFGSRLEVSDNYGNPVLYSEPYIADFTEDTPGCQVTDPAAGIDQVSGVVSALDVDPATADRLLAALTEAEDKLLEDPPDYADARDKVFGFIYELEDAVEAGELAAEEANALLNLASGIIASLRF